MKIHSKSYPLFTTFLLLTFFFSNQTSLLSQDEAVKNFLVVKPGDESATAAMASEYLSTIADYLRSMVPHLQDSKLQGWITNRLDSAVVVLHQHRPVFAFVPPGFYLEHLYEAANKITLVAQVPRFGKNVEIYYLVASKTGPKSISELRGKIVRSAFSIDWKYLSRVVFPNTIQPGIDFKLEPSDNLADEMFLLIEAANQKLPSAEQQPASALLLDEELKSFFEEDDLVWDEVEIIWSSQKLPRDLFVTIGNEWNEIDINSLVKAVHDMQNDEKGAELLELMQSSGFTKVDTTLLNHITKKYIAVEKRQK